MPMCVGGVVGVWGNSTERRPPFSRPPICRPPFACIVGPPDSLDHHQPKLLGDGGRESQVEQMIHSCKRGRATALGNCCPLRTVGLCVKVIIIM